jgi:hypothetical protein
MRTRATLLAALTMLLVAGVATGTKQDTRAGAKADAAKQVSELVLPPGAMAASSDPSASAALGERPSVPVTDQKYVIDDFKYWNVPGRAGRVARWIRAYAPANANGSYGGSESNGVFSLGWSFVYTPKVTLRSLDVEVAKAKGGGSAVSADGVAVWVPTRPSWDYIPSSVRLIRALGTRGRRHAAPAEITNKHDVQQVIRVDTTGCGFISQHQGEGWA